MVFILLSKRESTTIPRGWKQPNQQEPRCRLGWERKASAPPRRWFPGVPLKYHSAGGKGSRRRWWKACFDPNRLLHGLWAAGLCYPWRDIAISWQPVKLPRVLQRWYTTGRRTRKGLQTGPPGGAVLWCKVRAPAGHKKHKGSQKHRFLLLILIQSTGSR